MKKGIQLLILIFALVAVKSNGQNREISKKQIRKLSKIHLFSGKKAYSESFLKGIRGDSLSLYTPLYHEQSGLFYTPSKVDFNNFDRATIINKRSRIRNVVVAATTLGVASFFATKAIAKAGPGRRFVAPGIDPRVNRPLNSGNIEGIMAGVIGAGLGMLIGEKFFKKNINFNEDRRKAKRIIRSHIRR
ncbi:MAG: hypothetical protein P8M34_04900 [Saprospiraceae bacterium]|nr:hypothetical protein [Saprospiraceae bacterium]